MKDKGTIYEVIERMIKMSSVIKRIKRIFKKRKVIKNSSIFYLKRLGKYYCISDNPNAIWFDGVIYFCKNGKDHRKGKLSVIYPDGSLRYYENDKVVKHIKP